MATKTTERPRRMKREMVALFGEPVVQVARMVDPQILALSADLLDQVCQSADRLLELRGQPVAQRKHVASLPSNVRLLLCMWLQDMGTAAKLINRTEAQVSR